MGAALQAPLLGNIGKHAQRPHDPALAVAHRAGTGERIKGAAIATLEAELELLKVPARLLLLISAEGRKV